MHKETKLKKVKGQPRIMIEEFGKTRAPNAAYQVSRSSAVQFWRRFLRVLTIYGMSMVAILIGNVTSPVSINLGPLVT